MPTFYFTVQLSPNVEPELREVSAPDFLKAVQTLAAWCPGIHIIKLEGVCTKAAGNA